eukprot:CAMPEP_0185850926 /NCGR_PEP_ID=MMETSP1354-20130828/4865_1 /TAXON_ID=708628 /ORGANISM="Erythrolobus madagascarensis, Strain CCMP3276" /LENGTH=259 /DNA_ID=CAMNT_0028551655 /DNA_START=156 /DNA_END=935 /DNA_ORIENTATION=+
MSAFVGVGGVRVEQQSARAGSCSVSARRVAKRGAARRGTVRFVEEAPTTKVTTSTPGSQIDVSGTVDDWVEKARAKAEDLEKYLSDIDGEELAENASEAGKLLANNFLGGEWLQRGEVYGGAQLVLALLVLNGQPLLDGLVGFALGPVTMFAGIGLSVKAVTDLGFGNLSVWPSPVPGGNLVTTGLYEKVRHPVYSGALLASLGFASATGSPARFALTIGLAYLFSKKIEIEEEFLEEKYPDYVAYKEDVPFKILPKVY